MKIKLYAPRASVCRKSISSRFVVFICLKQKVTVAYTSVAAKSLNAAMDVLVTLHFRHFSRLERSARTFSTQPGNSNLN